jgi:cardiolipin synthase
VKLNVEWISGNRVHLLQNGDAYFPTVFDAIDAAEREILIETFILFEDRVGRDLQQHLINATARGVEVDLTVDGFGSPDLSNDFISALTDAGLRLHVYEPTPLVRQLKPLRRLHRKIVVVDGRIAFVGGINFSEDHLESFGAGPSRTMRSASKVRWSSASIASRGGRWRRCSGAEDGAPSDTRGSQVASRVAASEPQTLPGSASGICQPRQPPSPHRHRARLSNGYPHRARHGVIANAYFFPGYRLLRDLRRAASAA